MLRIVGVEFNILSYLNWKNNKKILVLNRTLFDGLIDYEIMIKLFPFYDFYT